MHIQLPTRVAYINGFKLMRTGLNDFVEPDTCVMRFTTLIEIVLRARPAHRVLAPQSQKTSLRRYVSLQKI